jgi:hypothetical protein
MDRLYHISAVFSMGKTKKSRAFRRLYLFISGLSVLAKR